MAITCYKNYGTPRNSTGVPATRTRYALASEIGLLAGHALCLGAPLPPWLKNQLWQLALSDVRGPLGARCGAKSIGLFAIKRKCDRKTACCAVVLSKLDSRILVVLFRGKSEGGTSDCHEQTHGTEQGPFSGCFDKTCSERL